MTCCAVTADGAFLAAGDSDGSFRMGVESGGPRDPRAARPVGRPRRVVPGPTTPSPSARSWTFPERRRRFPSPVEPRRTRARRVPTRHRALPRDADQSRLLVWRVGRRKNVSLKEKQKKRQRGNLATTTTTRETRRRAFLTSGASNTANDTSTYRRSPRRIACSTTTTRSEGTSSASRRTGGFGAGASRT